MSSVELRRDTVELSLGKLCISQKLVGEQTDNNYVECFRFNIYKVQVSATANINSLYSMSA